VDLNVWWEGTGRIVEGRYAYLDRSCGGRAAVVIVTRVAIFGGGSWYSANNLSRPVGNIVVGDSFAFNRGELSIIVGRQGVGCGGTAMALDLICDRQGKVWIIASGFRKWERTFKRWRRWRS